MNVTYPVRTQLPPFLCLPFSAFRCVSTVLPIARFLCLSFAADSALRSQKLGAALKAAAKVTTKGAVAARTPLPAHRPTACCCPPPPRCRRTSM